jgi:hypothetical protein
VRPSKPSKPKLPITKISKKQTKKRVSKKVAAIPEPEPFKIMDLATETRNNILEHLDYKSLLNFGAATKHFRELVIYRDSQLLKFAFVKYEVEFEPWKTTLSSKRNYTPCYGCRKTLPCCHFRTADCIAPSTAKGLNKYRRRCQTCVYEEKKKLSGPSRVVKHDSDKWFYCQGCKMVTHLVPKQSCGTWDHTADGKVWAMVGRQQVKSRSKAILCMECTGGKGN